MDFDALAQHRSDRDRFLAEHYASPVPEELRETFTGLDYYAPDPAWMVGGTFESVDSVRVLIPSSAGTESLYTMVGAAVLTIVGIEYRLVVLDDGDGGRFIPFRDGTAGDTTYAGGRYVGLEITGDGAAVVDFNRASNPWCVFDDEFTCPLPPPANLIAAPIEAGEKLWRPARPSRPQIPA